MVKNLLAMWEAWAQSLGSEDSRENRTAIHHSVLAWRIPWTGTWQATAPWGRKELEMIERLILSLSLKSVVS